MSLETESRLMVARAGAGGGRMAAITNRCGVFCGDDENALELDIVTMVL